MIKLTGKQIELVRRYATENKCGLAEAKLAVNRLNLLEHLRYAKENRDIDKLFDVVESMLEMIRFSR